MASRGIRVPRMRKVPATRKTVTRTLGSRVEAAGCRDCPERGLRAAGEEVGGAPKRTERGLAKMRSARPMRRAAVSRMKTKTMFKEAILCGGGRWVRSYDPTVC